MTTSACSASDSSPVSESLSPRDSDSAPLPSSVRARLLARRVAQPLELALERAQPLAQVVDLLHVRGLLREHLDLVRVRAQLGVRELAALLLERGVQLLDERAQLLELLVAERRVVRVRVGRRAVRLGRGALLRRRARPVAERVDLDLERLDALVAFRHAALLAVELARSLEQVLPRVVELLLEIFTGFFLPI